MASRPRERQKMSQLKDYMAVIDSSSSLNLRRVSQYGKGAKVKELTKPLWLNLSRTC